MVYCIFSKCMNDTVTSADLIGDGMIQISRWCSGERPIPKNVLEKYEENDYWNDMEEDFRTKIIPNLINELQVRSQLESLLDESIDVIGADKIQEMKELNKDKELCELFYRHCPSSKSEPELVAEIIDLLNAHTLTVSLAALTLEASGMDIEEFLYELKTTGIRTEISEEVELYKDETFSYGRMMEQHQLSTPCDKALLLDFKAELFVLRKEFANALKKRLKAIQIIENADTEDVRTITLLSNLYNNLSNTYLYLKKMKEAAEALKKAFELLKKHEHLGLMESHDTMQQIGNLANMLIVGKEYPQARELLTLYESLISEYENEECLDYGFCQTMFGILCYREGKATEAERHLLSAETIISDVMGTDNDYMKTVYRYLHSLYIRWKKPALAQKYKGKYLESSKNKLKISP